MSKKKYITYTIRIDEEILQGAKDLAVIENRSINNMIEELISRQIEIEKAKS